MSPSGRTDASKEPPRTPRRRARAIGDPNLGLLEFAARHRFLHLGHAHALLRGSRAATGRRLNALVGAGLLREDANLFTGRDGTFRITRAGLRLIGSALPAPRADLGTFTHDVGAAWLWLAARAGRFGELREVLSERELRSRDRSRPAIEQALAVQLGGFDGRGSERLHYPDLVLTDSSGRRIAIELELTPKSPAKLDRIFAGYAADPRIDVVLYLVEKDSIGRSVQAAARRFGIERQVMVQRVAVSDVRQAPGSGRPANRAHNRPAPAGQHALEADR